MDTAKCHSFVLQSISPHTNGSANFVLYLKDLFENCSTWKSLNTTSTSQFKYISKKINNFTLKIHRQTHIYISGVLYKNRYRVIRGFIENNNFGIDNKDINRIWNIKRVERKYLFIMALLKGAYINVFTRNIFFVGSWVGGRIIYCAASLKKHMFFFLNDSLHKEHEVLTIVKYGTMYLWQ